MPTAEAMTRRRHVQSLLPRIRGLAACNMTSTQIAAELGLRVQAVTRICNRLGIKFKKRAWSSDRLKRPPECPVNEQRKAESADRRFAAAMGRKTFDSAVEPPEPKWRRLPPVTIVMGSASSMGGRYGE